MKLIRILAKSLLSPVILALTLIVLAGRLITTFSAVVMNIIASILFLLSGGMIIFLHAPFPEARKPFFVGFLLCPYGLPLISMFCVEILNMAKDALKSI